jgi:cytochrome P450
VEELLRAESPLEISTPLFAREPICLAGETIERGDTVFISYGAANRDARMFPRPDVLDFGREKAQQHLAFGHGIHHCLGARLARAEGEIALDQLARRFPDLALDGDVNDLEWRPGLNMRGLRTLPLVRGT